MTPLDARRQIRILRVITRLNIGGPSLHAVLLSRGLAQDRFSTCLVIGEPDATEGELSELVRGPQVRIVRLKALRRSIRPWRDAIAFMQLLRIVWRERPQIIHTHMAKAGALGRLAGLVYNGLGPGRTPGARAVMVHTFHGHVLEGYFSSFLSRVFLAIERWLARRTDRLIAVSQTIREALVKKRIGRPEQWRVIPLGLDLSSFAQLPLPEQGTPIRVGMVGRLVPIKNPSLFLHALARVVRQQPDRVASGVIVGDGPLRQTLERQARELGVDRVLRFTGWQRELCAVYEGIDVACLTSWNEGTPVSLIEAMAAGRAVVATDVGGVRDLLADTTEELSAPPSGTFHVLRRGIMVRPGDPEGLASALKALAGDAMLRRLLGEAARSYVVQAFSQERLLRDLSAFYEAEIEERVLTS